MAINFPDAPLVNDTIVVNGSTWTWDGTVWSSDGELGYTGSQGIIGFTGSQGTTGFVGSQGPTGFTGSVGFTGSRGNTGFTGSAGPSTTINATNDTSATVHYPVFVAGTGDQTARIDTTSPALSFQPSTSTLNAGIVEAGLVGSGTVALTTNDGYGNANIAFNHKSGTPDVSGNSARIHVNVDAAAGAPAAMTFGLKSATTSGTAVSITDILTLFETSSVFGVEVSAPNFNSTSDLTTKENIEVIVGAIDKVSKINGVTFNFIHDDTKRRHVGVIAQEVEKVLPEAVRETSDGIKNVAYGNLVGLLIEAIKEQQKQIDEIKALIQK